MVWGAYQASPYDVGLDLWRCGFIGHDDHGDHEDRWFGCENLHRKSGYYDPVYSCEVIVDYVPVDDFDVHIRPTPYAHSGKTTISQPIIEGVKASISY